MLRQTRNRRSGCELAGVVPLCILITRWWLVFFVLSGAVASAQINRREFSSSLKDQLDLLDLHGFSGAVLVGNAQGREWIRGLGLANQKEQLPNTPETLFAVASISQHFTAAAILWLEQQGRLQVGDSLEELWPARLKSLASVTIEQLMSHRSGLPFSCDEDRPTSREGFLNCVESLENVDRPCQRFEYSNAGYAVLAALIQEISGHPYPEFLRRHLLQPAGMSESGFLDEVDRWPPARVAVQYTWTRDFGTELRKAMDWNYRGAADLVSNVVELGRWRQFLTRGFFGDSRHSQLMRVASTREASGGRFQWCLTGAMTLGYNARWCGNERGHILVLSNHNYGLAGPAPAVVELLDRVLSQANPVLNWRPKTGSVQNLASWAGRYGLDPHFELNLELSGETLQVSGRGQKAVNWLVASSPEQARELSRASRRASNLLQALKVRDFAVAGQSSGDSISVNALEGWLEGLESRHGVLQETALIGTIPQAGGSRSYVELRFERGNELRRLRWVENQLTSILEASLPLAPVRFIPVASRRLIGYHLLFPTAEPWKCA